MSVHVDFTTEHLEKAGLKVFGAFERIDKDGKKKAVLSWSDKDLSAAFGFIKDNGDFTGRISVFSISCLKCINYYLRLKLFFFR
mgnify:CR=1 FL=1